jgi:signal transduction histidine kinase
MKRLIRDLLDMRQIEAGGFSVDPHPEDVVRLVEDAIEPMHVLAEEKSIRLETRID